jgi:S1-C subfamily serine protease
LEKKATDSTFYWIDTASRLTDKIIDLKKNAKLFTDDWNAQVKRLSDEKAVLKSDLVKWQNHAELLDQEILFWRAAYREEGKEPNLPDPTPPVAVEPNFTDLVQTSLKGVVHLQAPSWQGSGFVVGPRLIVTARHCVEGVEDFVITTHDGHQVRATRAISDKEHDVAFIWVDDLECIANERGTAAHKAVLTPVPLGSIADVRLGQSVYVIGSPYGKVNFNSLTTGIISGVNRDWSPLGESYGWEIAFTVDSAGHPGNSGGPVFTMDGIVRGILVGGFSPVLISVMPCDLFMADLDSIRLMFAQDRYEREEVVEYQGWEGYGS